MKVVYLAASLLVASAGAVQAQAQAAAPIEIRCTVRSEVQRMVLTDDEDRRSTYQPREVVAAMYPQHLEEWGFGTDTHSDRVLYVRIEGEEAAVGWELESGIDWRRVTLDRAADKYFIGMPHVEFSGPKAEINRENGNLSWDGLFSVNLEGEYIEEAAPVRSRGRCRVFTARDTIF